MAGDARIALVGARNDKQSVENAAAINVNLTADEIAFINQELSLLYLNKQQLVNS